MYRESRKGFTLIEVLIVVAIIGILASVILIGLGPVTKKGRDARRISDLKNVQSGLELYFQKNGKYPTNPASWAAFQGALTGAGIGVPNVPDDPNAPNTHYSYGSNDTDTPPNTSYVLETTLEDPTNAALRNSVRGTVHGIDCGSAADPTAAAYLPYCVQL